jgi:rare lipoprotein A
MKTILRHKLSVLVKPGTLLMVVLGLSACSSAPDSEQPRYPEPNAGRYAQDKDSIPLRKPTAEEMQDPEPVIEPLSRGGNKPYNIYGVPYNPQTGITSYDQTGIASWYGNKFHGHLTSNGEIYDVYAMTAAHKTLPLPSYVRVTNLDNLRTAIVRVNDRGPFHDNRLIDLSYSAAYKLGVYPGGTGRVRVELIASPAMYGQSSFATPIVRDGDLPTAETRPSRPEQFVERPYSPGAASVSAPTVAPVSTAPTPRPASIPSRPAASAANSGCFIQLVASSNQAKLQQLGNEISQQLSVPVVVEPANGLFRLLAGPLAPENAQHVLDTVHAGQYPNAYFANKSLCG